MHGPHAHPWLTLLLVTLLGATALAQAEEAPARTAGAPSPASSAAAAAPVRATSPARRLGGGACPPYHLRDEAGNVIDPLRGLNADRPYSPRQTCGAAGCHDYEKITRGYHFRQGKGEPVPPTQATRYAWVTSPGQYGGRW